ncbi:hypothetical protein ACFVYD_23145 [Streptomyces sp. NPDC058301]|uniref:hypothetical protein n=1 Tax=Streptomyces sp. NPDC058301 TaxID=3346436 RepID=UPI0036EE2D89
MHQTRTTARLLVGVAALAVSGCVTVQRGPAPGPPPPPPPQTSEQTSEQADRSVRPQIVQAPVREALAAALPPAPVPRPRAAVHPAPAPHPHPRAHPAPPHPHPRPAPHPGAPHLPTPPPFIGDDVCDLGRSLGGWRPDSPEARICEGTYGK